MNIFAISDIHLALGNPKKTMEIFGDDWKNYIERLEKNWQEVVAEDDLVLIAGDISWGKDLKEAKVDLDWLDGLNGKKVMIKGNHDYFWTSKSAVYKILPPSCHIIQNDAFNIGDVSIGGTRLWDSEEYSFDEYINFQENPYVSTKEVQFDNEKIFKREINRLHISLSKLNKSASLKIAMLHFPPIGAEMKESRVSKILEEYDINIAIFGHLHHVKKNKQLFGKRKGIEYILTSADYLGFNPLKIA